MLDGLIIALFTVIYAQNYAETGRKLRVRP